MSVLKPFRGRRPFSMATACEKTGKSSRQIRRLAAEPREEYEARGVSRNEPWEKQGISRATWYRRRKDGVA